MTSARGTPRPSSAVSQKKKKKSFNAMNVSMPTYAALLSNIPRAQQERRDSLWGALVDKKGPRSMSSTNKNLFEA
jgi:hypothetical protein